MPAVDPVLLASLEEAAANLAAGSGPAAVTALPPKPPLAWGRTPDAAAFAGAGPATRGTWARAPPAEASPGWLWRMAVTSPGAAAQQVAFAELRLPPGADLFVYAPHATASFSECGFGCSVITPADSRRGFRDGTGNGTAAAASSSSGNGVAFMGPVIEGENLVLELYLPNELVGDALAALAPPGAAGAALGAEFQAHLGQALMAASGARLQVARVTQGHRSVVRRPPAEAMHHGGGAVTAKQAWRRLGASASCNNDALCLAGARGLDRAKQAVVQILTDGGSRGRAWSAVCTGTLLNSASGKPYIITAHHCLDGGEDVRNWGFLFNYELACGAGPGSSIRDHFVQGAREVFRHRPSDTLLLEMPAAPPAAFDPHYAGWDASAKGAQGDGHVSIHHPSGDFKKLSVVGSRGLGDTTCPFCGGWPSSHWLVRGWGDGTTERGSSGAALLDSGGRAVGVLSGGSAQCPDNNGFDFFGKLGVAFDAGLADILAGGGVEAFAGAKSQQLRELRAMAPRDGDDPGAPGLAAVPARLVLVEGGRPQALRLSLRAPPAAGASVRVQLEARGTGGREVAGIFPRDFVVRPGEWKNGMTAEVRPFDDGLHDGDVEFDLVATLSSAEDWRYNLEVAIPVLSQDNEVVRGGSIEAAHLVPEVPFAHRGSTADGRVGNTYRSRCNLGGYSPDYVFEYTPPWDHYVDIDLCQPGTAFDTTLYVFEGQTVGGVYGVYEQLCNDDKEGSALAEQTGCSGLANVPVRAGRKYYVVVDGYRGQEGAFELRIDPAVRPKSKPYPPDAQGSWGSFFKAMQTRPAAPPKEAEVETAELLTLSALGAAVNAGEADGEVRDRVTKLVARNPELVSVQTVGYSAKGQPLLVVQISAPDRPGLAPQAARPAVRLQAGVGGDIGSSQALLNLVSYLEYYYQDNADVTALLESTRLVVLPEVDPDAFDAGDGDGVSVAQLLDLNGAGADFRPSQKWVDKWLWRNQFALGATFHTGGHEVALPDFRRECEHFHPALSRECLLRQDVAVLDQLAAGYGAHFDGMAREIRRPDLAEAAEEFARRAYHRTKTPELVVGLDADAAAGEGLGLSDAVWEMHIRALVKYLQAATESACGWVVDADTLNPLDKAWVKLGPAAADAEAAAETADSAAESDLVVQTSRDGHFCRYVAPGACLRVRHIHKDGYHPARDPPPAGEVCHGDGVQETATFYLHPAAGNANGTDKDAFFGLAAGEVQERLREAAASWEETAGRDPPDATAASSAAPGRAASAGAAALALALLVFAP